MADELGIAEAADAARDGDYLAALRVLAQLDQDNPARLDLLARVHAQRGDLGAADQTWARVLDARPDDAAALAGRRLIARIKAGKRRKPVPALVWGAAGLVVAAAGAVLVWPTAGPPPAPVALRPTQQVENQNSADPQVRQMVAELEQQRQEARQLRDDLRALATALTGPGVQVEPLADSVRVVFDDGLFLPNGAELTDAGRESLRSVGARLRDNSQRVTVLGHGVVVAGGPTAGGSPVAVSRANSAARVLSTASGMPLTAFATATADQAQRPHPGADQTAQARNRTVTLLVTP